MIFFFGFSLLRSMSTTNLMFSLNLVLDKRNEHKIVLHQLQRGGWVLISFTKTELREAIRNRFSVDAQKVSETCFRTFSSFFNGDSFLMENWLEGKNYIAMLTYFPESELVFLTVGIDN